MVRQTSKSYSVTRGFEAAHMFMIVPPTMLQRRIHFMSLQTVTNPDEMRRQLCVSVKLQFAHTCQTSMNS